jgi:stalled ribosome alternative rescue factor ArfA
MLVMNPVTMQAVIHSPLERTRVTQKGKAEPARHDST